MTPETMPSSLPSLATAVGLLDRSHVGRLELLGEDRQRFLQGLVTCDVGALSPGEGSYGFFTSPQGKILADVEVLAHPDRLRLELPPGKAPLIAAHLGKYLIADRVEVRPLTDALPISVLGPGAEDLLRGEAELPVALLAHRGVVVAGIEVCLVRVSRGGQPGFDLWASASLSGRLVEALLARPGVVPLSLAAFDQLRVEAGVPAFGIDFGEEHFPQESGLEAQAVSYTKGCYLGQEIVARIHYRGKANHALRRLVFRGDAVPPAGTRLLFEGQEVGRVGSAVAPLGGGNPVGLAVIHRKGGEPGTVLEVEGGGAAEMVSGAAP